MNGESTQLNSRQSKYATACGRLIRWLAMWVVWNVPCGSLAPVLMGYALRSTPRSSELNNSNAQ